LIARFSAIMEFLRIFTNKHLHNTQKHDAANKTVSLGTSSPSAAGFSRTRPGGLSL
jgi:hypothetical protein